MFLEEPPPQKHPLIYNIHVLGFNYIFVGAIMNMSVHLFIHSPHVRLGVEQSTLAKRCILADCSYIYITYYDVVVLPVYHLQM